MLKSPIGILQIVRSEDFSSLIEVSTCEQSYKINIRANLSTTVEKVRSNKIIGTRIVIKGNKLLK